MRLNRVLAMLALAVGVGIAMIWVEGQNLRLEQKLAELYHQRDRLTAEQASLRVAISRLASPNQIMDSVKETDNTIHPPNDPAGAVTQTGPLPYYNR